MPPGITKGSAYKDAKKGVGKWFKDIESELTGISDRFKDLTGWGAKAAEAKAKCDAIKVAAANFSEKCALRIQWFQLFLGTEQLDPSKSIGEGGEENFAQKYGQGGLNGVEQILKMKKFTYDTSDIDISIGHYDVQVHAINKIFAQKDSELDEIKKNDKDLLKAIGSYSASGFSPSAKCDTKAYNDAKKLNDDIKEAQSMMKGMLGEISDSNKLSKIKKNKLSSLKTDRNKKVTEKTKSSQTMKEYNALRTAVSDALEKSKKVVKNFGKNIGTTGPATVFKAKADKISKDFLDNISRVDPESVSKDCDSAFRLANNQLKKDMTDLATEFIEVSDMLIYYHRFIDDKKREKPIDDTLHQLIKDIRAANRGSPYKEGIDLRKKSEDSFKKMHSASLENLDS